MSYILEALRKSEIERKQGEVPSLGSSVQIIHKPGTAKGPWLLWVLLVALVLNGVLLAWLFWPRSTPSVATMPAAPVVLNPQTQAPANETVNTPGSGMARDVQGSSGNIPVNRPTGSGVEDVISDGTRTASTTGSGGRPSQNIALPIEPVTMDRGPQGGEAGDVASGPVTGEAILAESSPQVQDEHPQRQLHEQNVGSTPAGAEHSDTVDEAPANGSGSTVPALGEMSTTFQRRVPDLVFNSHIFSSRPDARRVMINNEYLREGARFGDMLVEEITEDGVILSLDGEPFAVSVVRNWNRPR